MSVSTHYLDLFVSGEFNPEKATNWNVAQQFLTLLSSKLIVIGPGWKILCKHSDILSYDLLNQTASLSWFFNVLVIFPHSLLYESSGFNNSNNRFKTKTKFIFRWYLLCELNLFSSGSKYQSTRIFTRLVYHRVVS